MCRARKPSKGEGHSCPLWIEIRGLENPRSFPLFVDDLLDAKVWEFDQSCAEAESALLGISTIATPTSTKRIRNEELGIKNDR